jgi:SAM-dependent methyltransferase
MTEPESPQAALAETTETYDQEATDFAAYQGKADMSAHLDKFLGRLPDNGGLIFDAGCGTGRDVAAMVARGYPCIGLDLSAAELAFAASQTPDSLASWLVADLRHIPFNNGCARGIWTVAALLHLDPEGQAHALREFKRLLSPGGALFISTLDGPGSSMRTSLGGHRRWFWGTSVEILSSELENLGFQIVSAEAENTGFGHWVSILALAPGL